MDVNDECLMGLLQVLQMVDLDWLNLCTRFFFFVSVNNHWNMIPPTSQGETMISFCSLDAAEPICAPFSWGRIFFLPETSTVVFGAKHHFSGLDPHHLWVKPRHRPRALRLQPHGDVAALRPAVGQISHAAQLEKVNVHIFSGYPLISIR